MAKFTLKIFFVLFSGPKLPFKLICSAMVATPNGKGVILIGGHNQSDHKSSDALIELKGNTMDMHMEWIVLERKLEYARSNHIAIPIPNDKTSYSVAKDTPEIH